MFIIILGAVGYYFYTKRREAPVGRTTYEMTSTKESNSQLGNNSMFEKAD